MIRVVPSELNPLNTVQSPKLVARLVQRDNDKSISKMIMSIPSLRGWLVGNGFTGKLSAENVQNFPCVRIFSLFKGALRLSLRQRDKMEKFAKKKQLKAVFSNHTSTNKKFKKGKRMHATLSGMRIRAFGKLPPMT